MGHQKVGSYWYYFDPLDHGKMATGYVTDTEGDSYYYNTNGTLITGWQKLKGEENYRYFDAAGDGNGRLVGSNCKISRIESASAAVEPIILPVNTLAVFEQRFILMPMG